MKKNDLITFADILGVAGYILLITVSWKIALGVLLVNIFKELSDLAKK